MKALTSIAFIFLTAISAFAGVLYLELPNEISIETAISPNETEKSVIDDFVISETNKIDYEGADRVVILTKDGVPVIL